MEVNKYYVKYKFLFLVGVVNTRGLCILKCSKVILLSWLLMGFGVYVIFVQKAS